VLTPANIILTLQVAVAAVTALLAASLVALWRGQYRLHGRINVVFFVLTLTAVLGLEVIIRIIDPEMFYFEGSEDLRQALQVHLCFSIPAVVLMCGMLVTGKMHRRTMHLTLAGLFAVAWAGTFITGLFFLRVPT
jgi:uncharacterized membrane protein YozB (DUF420 family)